MDGLTTQERISWQTYAAIAGAAVALRLLFIILAPQAYGDAGVYLRVADNIFTNFCVSLSDPATAACVPHWGGNQLPGYPAFIALVWTLVGESLTAVRLAQTLVVAAAICWMVRAVGLFTGSPGTAILVGLVLAFSPLAIAWPRHLFTESLALATTIWVFAELILSLSENRLRLMPLAIALVCAALIRYDGILLCLPVALCGFFLHPPRTALWRGAILALVVAVPLGAWWVRSVAVGLPPLPVAVMKNGEQAPSGYRAWGATWSTNEYQLAGWEFPIYSYRYSAIRIDTPAYDNPAEQARVEALLNQLSEVDGQPFPHEIDEAFAALAHERRKRDPTRHWLLLPLQRAAAMWGNPYSSVGWPAAAELDTNIPTEDMRRLLDDGMQGAAALVLKYPTLAAYKAATTGYRWVLVVITVGLLALSWGSVFGGARVVLWLAVVYAVGRTGFYAFFFANSTRYIVEAVPGLELVAVLGVTILWRRWRTGATDASRSVRSSN